MEPVKKIRIYLAAIAANLSALAAGTTAGWASPVLPQLKSSDTPLSQPITSIDEALIASLIAVGAIMAPFLAGFLADKIGRKWTLLSSSAFFIIGYVLMLIAKEVWIIFIARLLHGFGLGFVLTVQPMYAGEIATDSVRGATGSLMQLFIVSGTLYVFVIGPFVSYNALQYFCLALPIVFATVFFFMPETPYYYAIKDKRKEAIKSLEFLRGQSTSTVQDEYSQIQKSVEDQMSNEGTIADIMKISGNRKAFFISLGLMAFQHLSGIHALVFNTQSIFESAHTHLDPAMATIIVGLVQVAASGFTPLFADRLDRKVILLISASMMAICLAGLGVFFYMKFVVGGSNKIVWLPLPALAIFNIAYYAGFGPIPWAILSEMFATNVKSKALSLVSSFSWIIGFVVTFFYPMLNAIGSYYAFWLFAIFCVFAFFFIMFIVMETKGLSLQEIQNRLNGKKP